MKAGFMENSRMLILTEDRYGVDFFKKLVKRLKREELVERPRRIDVEWLHGKCNPKLTRVLLPKSVIPLERIIAAADAEGNNKDEVIEFIKQHIPAIFKDITRYVIFTYSIEEWICDGLGIEWRGGNPVDCLNKYLREVKDINYEKYMLPDFAEKIDINKLRENNKEFNQFLNEISN